MAPLSLQLAVLYAALGAALAAAALILVRGGWGPPRARARRCPGDSAPARSAPRRRLFGGPFPRATARPRALSPECLSGASRPPSPLFVPTWEL